MGVRSKALSFAILVGAAASISGCAVGASSSVAGDEARNQASLDGAYYGDSVDADAVAEDGMQAQAPAVSDSTPQLVVEESEQLTSPNDDGLGFGLQRGRGFSRVSVELAGGEEPSVDVMSLSDPARIVVDLVGASKGINREVSIPDDSFVERVRVGVHDDRTRLVFDLNPALRSGEDLRHEVTTENGQLLVTFVNPAMMADLPVVPAPSSDDAIEVAAAPGVELETEVLEPVAAPTLPEPDASMAEEELLASEESRSSEESQAGEQLAGQLALDALRFEKTYDDAGTILLEMTDSSAFELARTAPSEYVLRIPGAEASHRTTIPQIAPKGFPGIRSARAVQRDGEVLVRMFVDSAVRLEAFPRGNEIVVQARPAVEGVDASARAQLETGDDTAAPEEPSGDADTTARANPTGIRSVDGSKIYTGRLISLDLQDTDIDNALRIIAEVSNLNIIASDDVSGKVTLRLIDVPWDQALDVILKTNGLDQVTEGNVIRIAPVDKLRQEREALREAKRAAENLEDLTVQYVRVSYARVSEMLDQVQSVLSERGTVAEDERTNQLIIKDIRKGHEQAVDLIKRLDLRTPQVLLETQIVEGQRNVLRDLGFQWNFSYIASPETGNATGLNFPNSVGVNGGTVDPDGSQQAVNFPAVLSDSAGSAVTAILESADGSRALTARLSALETEGKVKVISRPQVATVNNKTAEIKSVETVRVRLPDSGTSVATGAGASAAGGGRSAFEEIDVGIELTVTPQASPDYYVLMDIEARSSTFGSTVVDNIPSTLEREATSTILVKSGQTFALGGVYRIEDTDQVQGVPFLKDIPFLGHLFRRSFIDKSDEELIFFITPHIVEGSFDPSLM